MRKIPRILIFVFGCLLLSALGWGRAVAAAPDETTATTFGLKPFPTQQTLRVGLFVGGPFSIPFYVADKEGFFKELNIKIVYESFDNGPAQMEANSTWDISNTGSGGILSGMLGYSVKMIGVGEYERNVALFARPNSLLVKAPQNPASWKGTTWLYPMGTTSQAVLAEALRRVGLTLSDVRSVNMDVSSALTAFVGRQGDGVSLYNTTAFLAEDRGFVRLGDAKSYDIITPNGVMVTQDALKNKRDLIVTAFAMYYLTSGWIKSSPEHQAKAAEYLFQSAQDEGVASTLDIANRGMKMFAPLSMRDAINEMITMEQDKAGDYSKRPVSVAEENTLFNMMEFYISQKKYTNDDRNKILDQNLIDPEIAREAQKLLATVKFPDAGK